MKTVMFLETRMKMGGAEMMCSQIIRHLDGKRFRPLLCCLYERDFLGEKLAAEKIPVYDRLASGRWDAGVWFRLARLLRRESVDLLYIINQPLTQFWGTLAGRLAGVPRLVSAIHFMGRIDRVRRQGWINRLAFPFTDRIIALSESHKADLVKKEGLKPEKIEVISNGLEKERLAPAGNPAEIKKRLGLGENVPVVGITAMLRPEKDHALFLKSAQYVLSRRPEVSFLVIGDGTEKDRLAALVRELGIEKNVCFLGLQAEAFRLVSCFDVAVLSSRPVVETFPLSVLEYMAAAKPVVATRVGSLPDLVEEGRTGFLVESGDWKTLGERILTLLQDRGRAESMGQAGRKKVLQEYTLDQTIKKTEALFEKLLEEKKAS